MKFELPKTFVCICDITCIN